MSASASQITSLTIVYSTDYPRRRSGKHQSSVSLAFVKGIHRRQLNSPHKGSATRKLFPFDVPLWLIEMRSAQLTMHMTSILVRISKNRFYPMFIMKLANRLRTHFPESHIFRHRLAFIETFITCVHTIDMHTTSNIITSITLMF